MNIFHVNRTVSGGTNFLAPIKRIFHSCRSPRVTRVLAKTFILFRRLATAARTEFPSVRNQPAVSMLQNEHVSRVPRARDTNRNFFFPIELRCHHFRFRPDLYPPSKSKARTNETSDLPIRLLMGNYFFQQVFVESEMSGTSSFVKCCSSSRVWSFLEVFEIFGSIRSCTHMSINYVNRRVAWRIVLVKFTLKINIVYRVGKKIEKKCSQVI